MANNMVCNCTDWLNVLKDHPNLFIQHNTYGNIICWTEISEENHYHKVHNYGLKITYCPFCGEELDDKI